MLWGDNAFIVFMSTEGYKDFSNLPNVTVSDNGIDGFSIV